MLWEIANTPHRLLGTMHIMPKSTQWPDWFSKCHEGIEQFAYERETKAKADSRIGIDQTRTHLRLPNASDIYSRAAKLLASIGETKPIEAFRPWMLSLTVAALFQKHWGFVSDFGPDKYLTDLADKNKLPVKYLESRNNTLERLNSAHEITDFGLGILEETLTDIELGAGRLLTHRQLQAWLNSDLGEMGVLFDEEMRRNPVFYKALILQRNQDWLPVATKLAKDKKPSLFIVGALHTVGSGSLIGLMQSAGFKFNFIAR